MNDNLPPTNRLTLFHLLVWMTVTGVLLGLYTRTVVNWRSRAAAIPNSWSPEQAAQFKRQSIRHFALKCAALPFHAIAIAGTLLLPWRRRQFSGGFPVQPGHWLLLACGTFLLVAMSCNAIFSLFRSYLAQQYGPNHVNSIRWIAFGTPDLFTAALLFWGARASQRSFLWTLALVAMSFGFALQFVGATVVAIWGSMGPSWDAVGALLTIGLLLGGLGLVLSWASAGRDWRQGERRDIFHLLGWVTTSVMAIEPLRLSVQFLLDEWQ